MRTLSSGQDALVLQRDLAEVKLLTITTYSDRAAKTGATAYRFSDETVEYDGDTYSPLLKDVSKIVESMAHLPATETGDGGDTLTRKLTFDLVNGDYQGDRLILALEAGSGRIELAEVEYSTILISASEKASTGLRQIAGTGIHQVWFRGVITRAPVVSDDTLTMEAITEPVVMPWLYATLSTTARRDYGVRLPEIYGQSKRVLGVQLAGGWVTTLSQPMTEGVNTDVYFTEEDPGWGTTSFEAIIDGERVGIGWLVSRWIAWQRGLDGTVAAPHQAGAIVVEVVDDVVFGVAGHECHSVSAAYLRSSHNDMMWKIDPSRYAVDVADTTTISGETISTITIGSDNLQTSLIEASASAVVSQQPAFSEDLATTVSNELTGATSAQNTTWATGADQEGQWKDISTTEPYYDNDASDERRLRRTYVAGDFTGFGSNVVYRWRMVLRGEVRNEYTWSSGTITIKVKAWIKNLIGKLDGAEGTTIESFTTKGAFLIGDTFSAGEKTPLVHSDWIFPDDDTAVVDDFIGAYLEFAGRNSLFATPFNVDLMLPAGEWGIEIEYITGGGPIDRVNDAAIQAAAMGHDLFLYADVNGHMVPTSNTTYEAAADELIEHPVDILHHLIAERAGLGDGAVDHAGTFGTAAGASYLGTGVAMGFDARLLGFTWAEIALRVAFESRLNLLPLQRVAGVLYVVRCPHDTSGQRWSLSTTQDDLAATIDDYAPGLTRIGRSRNDLGSHFSAAYGFRADIGTGEEGFTLLAEEVPTGAEADLGVVPFPRWYLLCYTDDATTADVTDWLEYMAEELSRDGGGVVAVQLQHWIGYTLEPGDTATITMPWGGDSLCRLIEFSQTDRDDVQCRFVEVD